MQKKNKNWGFDTRDMDTSVRPQDDFYHYASGGWLKRNKMPKSESRWGSFTKLRRETDDILHKILRDIAARRGALPEREMQLRDFFRSGMDMATRNKRGEAPIAPWRALIRGIKTPEDLVLVIAVFQRAGIGGPWGFAVDQDLKQSNRHIIYLHQSGLGMPDRDYYLKDDPESKRVREAYIRYLKRMKQPVEAVMAIETKLAKASMSKEELREPTKLYHKYTGAKMSKLVPEVEWAGYFKALGTRLPKELIVMQPEFLKTIGKMLVDTPLADWQGYLEWHLLAGASSYLSTKLERESFAFYGTTLSGTKVMKPLWRRSLNAVNASLGELLGEIYVKEHFTPEAKRRMNELIGNLFTTYKSRIKGLDWMSPATKKKALKKLSQIRHKIGYPTKWKSYKGLLIKPDDYAGNALRVGEHEFKRQLKKLGKPIDRTEWLMYPQTVNAYYQPPMNEIVFPAGILQPPFFSVSADDALNYGAIGSVIGHEISHAFDDEGSQFDGYGNIQSWWTKDDRKRFMKKAKVLVDQFNGYSIVGGLKVKGQLTLGENIADLGGASIAYDAYQRHLAKLGKGACKDIDGFTPEQRYFLGLSLFERENSRPEGMKTRVLTDPHSPPIFRVNGPASNLPEFYAAWGVKKGDKLYRSPAQRAKIW